LLRALRETQKKIVGTGSLFIESSFFTQRKIGHIEYVSIHSDATDPLDVATKIVSSLKDLAQENECDQIHLSLPKELKRLLTVLGVQAGTNGEIHSHDYTHFVTRGETSRIDAELHLSALNRTTGKLLC